MKPKRYSIGDKVAYGVHLNKIGSIRRFDAISPDVVWLYQFQNAIL